jgi:DNA-directed RNA polymerase specialized sigma24 family protein
MDQKNHGREVLLSLTEKQWFDLLDRLLLFASSHYFRIDGRDPIQDAILAVIEGRRSWDLERSPFHNLCSIIRSVTSNQLAKDKKYISLNSAAETPETCPIPQTQPLNPSQVETYERRESDEKFCARLQKSLQGDDLSLRVASHLIENDPEWRPGKIAKALGEETKDINNTRKRLQRKLRMSAEVPKEDL